MKHLSPPIILSYLSPCIRCFSLGQYLDGRGPSSYLDLFAGLRLHYLYNVLCKRTISRKHVKAALSKDIVSVFSVLYECRTTSTVQKGTYLRPQLQHNIKSFWHPEFHHDLCSVNPSMVTDPVREGEEDMITRLYQLAFEQVRT